MSCGRFFLNLKPGEAHLWSGKYVDKKKQKILLRNIAENYTGNALRENCLSYLPRGKPIFKNETFHFSVSHTANRIFIVFANFEVGVDVEMNDREVSLVAIAQRYFDADECAFLEACSEKEVRKMFFRLWVRKEAAVKMTGEGLASGLQKIKVNPQKQGWSLHRDGEALFVQEINPYPGAVGAVVARRQFSITAYQEF